MIIAAAAIGWKLKAGRGSGSPPALSICLLVASWLWIPILCAWLATSMDTARIFYHRYLIAVFPAAALLTGLCIQAIDWRWLRATVGVLTVACAIWGAGLVERIVEKRAVIEPRGENWRAAVAWLNNRLPESGYPVLVYSGLIEADELLQLHDELLDDYCLAPVNSLYPLDIDRGDLFPLSLNEPGDLIELAHLLMVHRGGAWLVVRGDKQKALRVADNVIAHLAPGAVQGAGMSWRVAESQSFGKVQVLLLSASASDSTSGGDPSVAGP